MAKTSAGIHTSTGNDEWLTPPEIASILDRLGVAFDPCWAPGTLYTPALFADVRQGVDGLALPWHEAEGLTYSNMPFSQLLAWYRKAREEREKGAEVLCLSPARTETEAFQEHVFGHATAALALRGRLSFFERRPDGSTGPRLITDAKGRVTKSTSTFSSWLVYYGDRVEVIEAFNHLGHWIETR